MAYESGFLEHRIIVKRKVEQEGSMGRNSSRYEYEPVCTLHANFSWTKGKKALQEGALDAYDTVMIRTRWSSKLTRDRFIEHEGRMYQILSFNGDKRQDEIQIIALEMATVKPND